MFLDLSSFEVETSSCSRRLFNIHKRLRSQSGHHRFTRRSFSCRPPVLTPDGFLVQLLDLFPLESKLVFLMSRSIPFSCRLAA